MRLAGQIVSLLLTDDGYEVLSVASGRTLGAKPLTVTVEESDDMGLWLRIPREDQMHLLLVRWDYILAIDLPSGSGRLIGMKR